MANPTRLLIVDDNEDILSTFYEFFNSMGYEVKTAVDGFAALKVLRDKPDFFDCLITDLVMPNISGVGLISIVTLLVRVHLTVATEDDQTDRPAGRGGRAPVVAGFPGGHVHDPVAAGRGDAAVTTGVRHLVAVPRPVVTLLAVIDETVTAVR